MDLRQLLNVAYARLALGRDEEQLEELDALLADESPKAGKAKPKGPSPTSMLLAAARMPQQGAAVGPKKPKPRPAGAVS